MFKLHRSGTMMFTITFMSILQVAMTLPSGSPAAQSPIATRFNLKMSVDMNMPDGRGVWTRTFWEKDLEWSVEYIWQNDALFGYLNCMKMHTTMMWKARATWHFEVHGARQSPLKTNPMSQEYYQRASMVPLLAYTVRIGNRAELEKYAVNGAVNVVCVLENVENLMRNPKYPEPVDQLPTSFTIEEAKNTKEKQIWTDRTRIEGLELNVEYKIENGMLAGYLNVNKRYADIKEMHWRGKARWRFAVASPNKERLPDFIGESHEQSYWKEVNGGPLLAYHVVIATEKNLQDYLDAKGKITVLCNIEMVKNEEEKTTPAPKQTIIPPVKQTNIDDKMDTGSEDSNTGRTRSSTIDSDGFEMIDNSTIHKLQNE